MSYCCLRYLSRVSGSFLPPDDGCLWAVQLHGNSSARESGPPDVASGAGLGLYLCGDRCVHLGLWTCWSGCRSNPDLRHNKRFVSRARAEHRYRRARRPGPASGMTEGSDAAEQATQHLAGLNLEGGDSQSVSGNTADPEAAEPAAEAPRVPAKFLLPNAAAGEGPDVVACRI